MITSVPNITGQIMTLRDNHRPWQEIDNLLKTWANSIIDECAGNFECTMELDEEEENNPNTSFIGQIINSHPVLVRQSILNVKNQIK